MATPTEFDPADPELPTPATEFAQGASQGSPAARLAAATTDWESRLCDELAPQGILQKVVLGALARNLASADMGAAAEIAALEFSAKNAAPFQLAGAQAPASAALVATLNTPHVARAASNRAASERMAFQAIRVWQTMKLQGQQPLRVSVFGDEDACVEYLAQWQRDQVWECGSCGGQHRWRIASRPTFECTCGNQHSVREGTMFARSRIPLLAWFDLLTALLIDPQLTAKHAAASVPVVRVATLRTMLRTSRSALAHPDGQRLLAGLPDFIERHLRQVYASLHPPIAHRQDEHPRTISAAPSVFTPSSPSGRMVRKPR